MTVLVLAGAWLLGTGGAALGGADAWPAVIPSGSGAATGLLLARRPREALLAVACALIVLAGVWRYEAAAGPRHTDLAALNGAAPVTLRGTVASEPEERGRAQTFRLRVDEALGLEVRPGGKVLVTTRPFPRFRYGDRLDVRGRLTEPASVNGFDFRAYLARQGVVSTISFPSIERTGEGGGSVVQRALWSVRRPLAASLDRALREPEAALAKGILLGLRSSIPRDLTDDFNAAGISHLVAISGYNVTLVAGLSVAVLTWPLGRRRATAAAAVIVLTFVLLVGAAPSVLRAGVMGLLLLGASLLGRPGSVISAIAFSAALLTALDPTAIDDVAFQLSFASTLGLVLLSGRLSGAFNAVLARLFPGPAAAALGESAAVTIAANLAVLPIIGATFGRISLVAVPANLVAVPLMPPILAASALTAAGGTLWPALAPALGAFARLPLEALVAVGRFGAALPGSTLSFSGPGALTAAAVYAVIGLAALALHRLPAAAPATPRPRRLTIAAAAGLVAMVAAGSWSHLLDPGGDRLRVTFLDVGQGDAVLISAPGGRYVLVDGGPGGPAIQQALGRALPAGVKKFDILILTHPQEDHVTGLVSVAERYDVGLVLTGPVEGDGAGSQALRRALDRRASPTRQVGAGDWIDLGKGARLHVLWPHNGPRSGDANEASLVLRLVYGSVAVLLTGDIDSAVERELIDTGVELGASVLKVAHHGSDGSTSARFVSAVRPALAVISVGRDNVYLHPSPTTRLRLTGIPVFRTDENGDVRIETDGRRLWAAAQRGGFRLVPAAVTAGER